MLLVVKKSTTRVSCKALILNTHQKLFFVTSIETARLMYAKAIDKYIVGL